MFINEPLTHRTIDRSRDAVLEEASFVPDQTIIFLLTWQGRKIPFLGKHLAVRDSVSSRSIVDWQVFGIGQPQTLGTLQIPGCTFIDAADKAAAADLIRDALKIYVIAFGQGPNDLGSIDIDLT
jgi:hypothetical protein